MKKKHKIITIASIALLIAITAYIYYSHRFSKQIEEIIADSLPENISFEYGELNANILFNSFEIIDLQLKILDQGIDIHVDEADINGIDFATILVSENISVGEINLKGTDFSLNPASKKDIQNKSNSKKSREIEVQSFKAHFKKINIKDSLGKDQVFTNNTQLAINQVLLKPSPNKKLPKIEYKIKHISTDSLSLHLKKQRITSGSLEIDASTAHAQNIILSLKEQGAKVEVKDLGLYGAPFNSFLQKDSIALDSVLIANANILLDKSKKENTSQDKKEASKPMVFFTKVLKVKDAQWQSKNAYGKKTLSLDNANALLKDITFNTRNQKEKPIKYTLVNFKAENIEQKTNFLHQLNIEAFNIDSSQVKLSNLSLKPLYNKIEFQKHIEKEQDVITLNIPEVTIKDYDYSFQKDQTYFKANLTTLNSPKATIYRSKLPPEPQERKPLFSEMLRKMDLGLNLKEIAIKKGHVEYEEHHDYSNPPGKLIFGDFNAKITNINNQESGKNPVSIVIDTRFMDTAPTHIQWEFNIFKPYDKFRIWGSIKNLPAEKINLFFVNNLNVKAKGYVKDTHFDFSGNDISATGILNMDYEEFEVELLKKESKEKKGLLSTIANWFINDEEKEKNKNKTLTVERDQTKSFFNYFWLCIREGLKHNVLKVS